MNCCSKKFVGFLLLIAILAEGCLLVWMKFYSPTGMLGWVETADAAPYYGPTAPDPPYHLSIDDRDMLTARVAESLALSVVGDDFSRITALREWTRTACPKIALNDLSNDPSDILEAFDRGEGGACGSLATLYCAVLISHGYRARLIQLVRDTKDVPIWGRGPLDTHVTVEVFNSDDGEWMIGDPTFNAWFHFPDCDIKRNARDLQLIAIDPVANFSDNGSGPFVRTRKVIAETRPDPIEPTVENYYIDPVLLYQNVFFLYYDVFDTRERSTTQKIVRFASAHVLGTEKVVWLLPPGQDRSYIFMLHTAANWIPIGIPFLLLLLLIPGSRPPEEEEEDEEE